MSPPTFVEGTASSLYKSWFKRRGITGVKDLKTLQVGLFVTAKVVETRKLGANAIVSSSNRSLRGAVVHGAAAVEGTSLAQPLSSDMNYNLYAAGAMIAAQYFVKVDFPDQWSFAKAG
jgi:hypothetical protein